MSGQALGQARCLLPGSDYIPRVDSDATTEALCKKVWAGERITGDEAARLSRAFIHISEPKRLKRNTYAVFCLKQNIPT